MPDARLSFLQAVAPVSPEALQAQLNKLRELFRETDAWSETRRTRRETVRGVLTEAIAAGRAPVLSALLNFSMDSLTEYEAEERRLLARIPTGTLFSSILRLPLVPVGLRPNTSGTVSDFFESMVSTEREYRERVRENMPLPSPSSHRFQ